MITVIAAIAVIAVITVITGAGRLGPVLPLALARERRARQGRREAVGGYRGPPSPLSFVVRRAASSWRRARRERAAGSLYRSAS